MRLRSRTQQVRELRRQIAAERGEPVVREEYSPPTRRGDCLPGGCNAARPCPWVACKYHLYLEVNPQSGSIKLAQPAVEPWDLAESCALDLADRAALTLEAVAAVLNVTRERVRQIESAGLATLRQTGAELDQASAAPAEPAGSRRSVRRAAQVRIDQRIARALRSSPADTDREIAASVGAGRVLVARVRRRMCLAPARRRRRLPVAEVA